MHSYLLSKMWYVQCGRLIEGEWKLFVNFEGKSSASINYLNILKVNRAMKLYSSYKPVPYKS